MAPADLLALAAALASGLVAGTFFAFSSFVMRSLAARPAAEGIAAMQAINVAVVRSWFIAVFFLAAALSAAAIALAAARWQAPGAGWLAAGGVLYLAGCFLVTIACNVPRNNALAKLPPADAAAPARWQEYVSQWTAWNTVRTLASLAAAAAFTLALWR